MALEYLNRIGTDCCKWDDLKAEFGEDGLLAMWVADMDFASAPPIKEALHKYVDGAIGYASISDHYKQAFIEWEKKYHGYEVKPEWICFSNGIVSAFYWAMCMMTQPGDAVILLSPIYYPMKNAINLNDRKLVMCDLVRSGDTYVVDFEKFEKDIVDNSVKVFILSSPHNPTGKMFTKEELKTMLDICKKHGVFVISDEIHQDFEFGGHVHTPSALLGDYDDMMITMAAVSKTFNLAGAMNSFIIIPNEEIRAKYIAYTKQIHGTEASGFGLVAVETAMREGRPWFEEVKAQIWENYLYVKETFAKELPDVIVEDLQATYLLWLDFGKYFSTQKEVDDFFVKKCKLAFDFGSWFGKGGDDYAQFVRMNLATRKENVIEACDRIIKGIKEL